MSEIIPVGAHLVTPRRGFKHHGIYAGNGLVIHYPGLVNGAFSGPVEEVSVESFHGGHGFEIIAHESPRFSGPEAASRARQRLGECHYHLLKNNCEHFCRWCITGIGSSDQVRKGVTAAGSFIASRYLVAAGAGASAPFAGTLIAGLALGYGVTRLAYRLQDKKNQPAKGEADLKPL